MNFVQAALMGLVQGLTEFLPVSSSGHLAIFKILFHVNTDTGILFDVLLHIGTLISIFVAFWEDIWELIVQGFGILWDWICNIGIFFSNLTKRDKDEYIDFCDTAYRRMVMLILVATIPTGILGYVGADFVEGASRTLLIPGICLIITAVLLFIADMVPIGKKNAKNATYLSAFEIGMAQGMATLPGLSRSGTTIAACLLCGYNKKFAVKFSFIMSIPAVLGAAILELKDIKESPIVASDIPGYIVGMIVAAVVGYICIKTILVIVKKRKFIIFSIYCSLVGIISVAGYFLTRK